MALATAGNCDHCRSQYKDPITEDLGEVVTHLKVNFCTTTCRDQFIGMAMVSDRLDYEHKEALAGNYPHVVDAHIEGHLTDHKKHRQEKDKKAVVSNPPSKSEPIQAGVITSLRRKFTNKIVVDLSAISSDLIKRVEYYSSRMDTSEAQIAADGEAVMASLMGRISEKGYPDLVKARAQIARKLHDAVRLAANSQDYFPQSQSIEIKKSHQTPSWSNKELGSELAGWFLASADPSKDYFNQLLMTQHILTIVLKVIEATGVAGYLFLSVFPIDVRGKSPQNP